MWSQKVNDMFAAALACMHCVAKNFLLSPFFLGLHLLNHSFSGSFYLLAFIVWKQVVCILTSLVVNIITLLDITCSCYIF